MKKLLLIVLLIISTSVFAQQTEKVGDNTNQKTISQVKASPNPVRTSTKISFYNDERQKVILTVKNLLGKTVYSHTSDSKKGINNIPFYRDNLIAGIYIYSIQTDKEIISKRLVIR